MTTAKVNNRFDYISVRVTFAPKNYVTMTWSRGGMKLSGTPNDWIAHGKAIMQAMECPKGTTIGQWAQIVAMRAEQAQNIGQLADRMNYRVPPIVLKTKPIAGPSDIPPSARVRRAL